MGIEKEYITEVFHWWDKVNGNSYFSARIYSLEMELLKIVPFQYGDKSHSEDVITANIQARLPVYEIRNSLFQRCYMNHMDGLKRVAVNQGKVNKYDAPKWGESVRQAI